MLYGHFLRPSRLEPLTSAPSERLLDTALAAVETARSLKLEELGARVRRAGHASSSRQVDRSTHWLIARLRGKALHAPYPHPSAWPGQHYKLLAALVAVLRPTTVIELGTATGMSTLAMKAALPAAGKIFTFDVVGWQEYPGALLCEQDFADGSIEQRVDDLSAPAGWRAHADLLKRAEFILVDTLHDGHQERNFLRGFEEVGLAASPIVMFDDIRLWRMQQFWQEIRRPKLDLTSFGHWSGTGLVDFA